ncbi:hypothetical protein [Rhodopirellula halodulae]|uniref:hypothetical protein n=1 Tax=Rhodopirellula halodulae TaxID=2894198 RepID=UPI001E2F3DB8|nr:hypothetical protein [Rhodopirellula sp. JC737]MCC9657479.1 hypothetical protein [Rhodopirellula sp. JC737]
MSQQPLFLQPKLPNSFFSKPPLPTEQHPLSQQEGSQAAISQPQAGSHTVSQAGAQPQSATSQPQAGSQAISQGASQQLLQPLPPNNLLNKPPLPIEHPLSQQEGSQAAISQPQAGSHAVSQAGAQPQSATSQPQAGSQLLHPLSNLPFSKPHPLSQPPQGASQPQSGSQAGAHPQSLSQPPQGASKPQVGSQTGASQQAVELPQPFMPSMRSSKSKPKLCVQTELATIIVSVKIVRFIGDYSPSRDCCGKLSAVIRHSRSCNLTVESVSLGTRSSDEVADDQVPRMRLQNTNRTRCEHPAR